MDFAAVLVGDEVAAGGAGISAQDDAILEDDAADGGSGLGHLGRGQALLKEEGIPINYKQSVGRVPSPGKTVVSSSFERHLAAYEVN